VSFVGTPFVFWSGTWGVKASILSDPLADVTIDWGDREGDELPSVGTC
jgi:hypothetical protein